MAVAGVVTASKGILVVVNNALLLQSQLQKAKRNKKSFEELATRVKDVAEVLETLTNQGVEENVVEKGLEIFERALESAEKLLQKYGCSNVFMHCVKAGGFGDRFARVNTQLNEAEQHLTLTLAVEQRQKQVDESKKKAEDEETRGPATLQKVLTDHKKRMQQRYGAVFEGLVQNNKKTPLNKIFTQLYITEGESEEVNRDHEIWQIEEAFRKQNKQHTAISINDIFKGEERHIRTVMTKGVAGVGKTVSVQKFILDWAEGLANDDVNFILCLPFRELNLLKDDEYSLRDLMFDFYEELGPLTNMLNFQEFKVVFILDGLDECRFPLDFQKSKHVSKIEEKTSLDILITNLLKGNLLQSALVWITSRPAAAGLVPSEHIDRCTEVRGFNDEQKIEYFKKKLGDDPHAEKIIAHVKTTRSLFIMCHIPVFCCIAATVMQRIMAEGNTEQIPTTLTEMYVLFLCTQLKMTNHKFVGNKMMDRKAFLEENKDGILKLAELAFRKLEGTDGSILFYEDDLRESGISLEHASVLCTEFFKVDRMMFQKRFYSFVHLSIQEFLAALHVFASFLKKDMEALKPFLEKRPKKVFLYLLLKSATAKALQSNNGHLDLFVRFLMGISLDSNQSFLQGLLPEPLDEDKEDNIKSMKLIVKHIDSLVLKDLSPERFINLINCLTELQDNSLHKELQLYLQYIKCPGTALKPAHCSALANMILLSEEPLEEFDLKRYNVGDEDRERLVPAVRWCKKARLAECKLSAYCGEIVASALQSEHSPLRVLNLEMSYLTLPGLNAVCSGLTTPHCKLQALSLAGCRCVSDFRLCVVLGKALQSISSHLTELDLSYNILCSDEDMRALASGLKNPGCKVGKLRLRKCSLTDHGCEMLASVLCLEPCCLRELDLRDNKLNDKGIELLSEAMKTPQCNLEKLRLAGCKLTESSWKCLMPVFLGELDLSESSLQLLELEQLSVALRSPDCRVNTLRLQQCFLKNGHCEVLALVLSSDGSHLRELDLGDNDLQDSGVELLSSGLKNSQCTLETLRLSFCGVTEKGCENLASALSANPSYLRELDLSYNHPGETGVQLLTEKKDDPDCKLETLNVDNNAECWMKSGLRKYSCELTLDTNTMNQQLYLSEGNRRVTCVFTEDDYPSHSERFANVEQVLATDGFSGRCYWEAECHASCVYLGMTYKDVERRGGHLGHNEKSWALRCDEIGWSTFSPVTAYHNNDMIMIESPGCTSSRVGVYLDWPTGTLSFYSVCSDTLTHLHTFHHRFTEPLYPGIGFISDFHSDNSVLLCEIE
ncbi:NACHT, LRR and PYD domains-containing protein 12-like [Clupea harengus]|uniref:NACHT, LRR and PYD domains-containing protein 12-like n=1 Tax=Clupea harengus TaxID=7950 RepID=A0A8M1KWQ9_CLUHA|nr:NACHT, LRR and PYD domains-containing protein 12-like [Clupea harengus]XP_042566030.1 NACHT, LRR and PYD domains-containing protein 12-like [Clupea harengus]XP_042566031.1 NACHT, LRR and PYD domains-containing protein 12-like [Clupea harengus]XP_042566032.1 NACHT, LRR and PYD domains-containing protein 12-like [Clupea harengus]XP_042566033.1 NACHT, LRR and PYD domains-containing protein 12-like [Clupea harengus]XP_042566034.1 NACHT, LRR and PYD domains-containing protein 12-like [Clupea har